MKRNVERDKAIIKFIEDMRVSSFSTIKEVFFKDTTFGAGYNVMQRLSKYQEVESERHYLVNEYIYWIPKNKPKQLKHDLLRSEFYKYLSTVSKIDLFKNEFTHYEGIRPDAFIVFDKDGKKYFSFLEVELSGNPFNLDKYVKLYKSGIWRENLDEFPFIFALTDKDIGKVDNIKVLQINEDFKNFEKVIKSI